MFRTLRTPTHATVHLGMVLTRELCRYMEIYNESVNDLLNPAGKNLSIYEHPKKGVFVNGLAEEVCWRSRQLACGWFALISAPLSPSACH